MKADKMIPGVNYERINARDLHITFGEARDKPTLIAVDTVMLCAGQLSERTLADTLATKGIACHVIGDAEVAVELDPKRGINQGTRLAATL